MLILGLHLCRLQSLKSESLFAGHSQLNWKTYAVIPKIRVRVSDFSGCSWLSSRYKWATVSAPLKYWCTTALVVGADEELAVPLLSKFMLYEKLISPTLTNKLKYSHFEKEGSYINVLVIIHLRCMILCFTLYFWILTSIWTTSLSARSSILAFSRFQNSCFFKRHHQPCYTSFCPLPHTCRIYLEIILPCGSEQFELNLDLWQLWGP